MISVFLHSSLVQTLLKHRSNLAETSLKPRSNLSQSSLKARYKLVQSLSEVWLKFGRGLSDIMLLYYAFSMQTQQPDIINPIQYNSGNLEIAGLWLVELCPLNPIKRFRSYSIVFHNQLGEIHTMPVNIHISPTKT